MWYWEQNFDRQREHVTLKLGPRGKSYILGMYESIRIMAERGFNVIVDDVCLDAKLLRQVATILCQFKVYFVGILCQLPILEERERLRGNRVITSARGQYDGVHSSYTYDVMVDTSETSVHDCVLHIKAYIESHQPQAFKKLTS